MAGSDRAAALRASLSAGVVIPAHPLALTADRKLDERHQRALTRYYIDAGSGGLAVGVPGVLWIVGSGAWDWFYDVFTVWNPMYMQLAMHEFHWRVKDELHWFPPWSLRCESKRPCSMARSCRSIRVPRALKFYTATKMDSQ